VWAIVSTDPTRDSALLRRRSLHRVPFGTRHWTRFRAPNSQKQAGDPLIHERNSARKHISKRRVRWYLISFSSLLPSLLCSLLISPLVSQNRSAPFSKRSVPRPCNPSPHPSVWVERGECGFSHSLAAAAKVYDVSSYPLSISRSIAFQAFRMCGERRTPGFASTLPRFLPVGRFPCSAS